MSQVIIRLDEAYRELVLDHLLRLSREDRYTRFCASISNDYIKHYVESVINFTHDAHFGVIDDGKLIALASCVKLNDGSAELAFSIDADRRGTGLARKLLETTIDYAHAAGAAKLCMSCLRTNKKMRELAKSFGLNLTITYDEVYAELGISR